ncbi:hypothetical protein SRHO_G00032940 [Serrasalmus rhombeus]
MERVVIIKTVHINHIKLRSRRHTSLCYPNLTACLRAALSRSACPSASLSKACISGGSSPCTLLPSPTTCCRWSAAPTEDAGATAASRSVAGLSTLCGLYSDTLQSLRPQLLRSPFRRFSFSMSPLVLPAHSTLKPAGVTAGHAERGRGRLRPLS